MNLVAVYHINWLEYREALPDGSVLIRLRAARGDLQRVTLRYAGTYDPERFRGRYQQGDLAVAASDELHDWWELRFTPPDRRLSYYFELSDGGELVYLDQDGFKGAAEISTPLGLRAFPFAYAWPREEIASWALGSVGYQIFPDRFCRAGQQQEGLEPWTSHRVSNRLRFGGDLKGIQERIPYLEALGITVVYLTPIFASDTAHRYDTRDYFQVDPLLGTAEDLKALTAALHERGMRLILDGVFNHCGYDFAPFQDALKRGKDSPWYAWFHFDAREPHGYETFASVRYMPKLNLRNPEAQQYFLEVGRHWIREADIDGWRLDVAPEVWPDFWRQFRKAIKAEKPDALLVTECWDDSREWLSQGDMFDATMHYLLSRPIWRFFALQDMSLPQFDAAVNRALICYPSYLNAAQWTFLSSHDTPRFLTRAGGDQTVLRMAAFFQMTVPGLPIVYYGDELGMQGGEDPDCRRPMAWDSVEGNALHAWYRQLIAARNRLPALQAGAFRSHYCGREGLYAYLRTGEEPVLCALCTGDQAGSLQLQLPEGMAKAAALREHLSGKELPVREGRVQLQLARGQGYILSPL